MPSLAHGFTHTLVANGGGSSSWILTPPLGQVKGGPGEGLRSGSMHIPIILVLSTKLRENFNNPIIKVELYLGFRVLGVRVLG